MSDEPLRGPAEARLLKVERGLSAMESDLRNLRRQTIALGQGIWQEWSDVSAVPETPAPAPTPSPTPTPTFTACCTTISPGPTIAFTDAIWGSGTMTYNASLGLWIGWLSDLNWPGSGACGPATIAVSFLFSATTQAVQVSWIINSATSCPVASTPASAPGAGQSWSTITYFNPSTVFYCNNTPITAFAFMGTTAPELLLRAGHSSETITLTFNGTTATNLTSDFANVCTCITTSITLTDSVYGPCTLAYNPITQSWVGCRTVSYAGTTNCAAGSIAIQYTIEGSPFGNNWQLLVNWAGHVVSGHACPLPGSTCSSTLGFSRQVAATYSCNGTTTWTFPASANSPWPGTGAATCKIILPVP